MLVDAREDAQSCSVCGGPMRVQKTWERTGMTLRHGSFRIRQTVHACPSGCRKQGLAVRGEAPLADLIPPRGVVGYDVIAHVGLERFLHHRQREEIRAALAAEQMRFQILAPRDRAFQRGNQRTLRSLPGLPRKASSRFGSRSACGAGIRWRLAASHRCDGRGRPRHAWRKNLKAHCW